MKSGPPARPTAPVRGFNFRICPASCSPALRDATLDGVDVSNANLAGADLRGAVFGAVNIKDSAGVSTGRLWPAILMNADFGDADLRGANLSGATFDSAAE